MSAKEVMAIITRLEARKDRQSAALEITLSELKFWETELEKLRKPAK